MSSIDRAQEYRQTATELLDAATTAHDDSVRGELLKLAENYGRLANALETGRMTVSMRRH
jgi:hypothetical protein